MCVWSKVIARRSKSVKVGSCVVIDKISIQHQSWNSYGNCGTWMCSQYTHNSSSYVPYHESRAVFENDILMSKNVFPHAGLQVKKESYAKMPYHWFMNVFSFASNCSLYLLIYAIMMILMSKNVCFHYIYLGEKGVLCKDALPLFHERLLRCHRLLRHPQPLHHCRRLWKGIVLLRTLGNHCQHHLSLSSSFLREINIINAISRFIGLRSHSTGCFFTGPPLKSSKYKQANLG